jgi:hypothetical protein
VFFFLGEIFAKFRPEKYNFNLRNGFSMEKMAKNIHISKKTVSRLPDFYDKFQ